MSSELRVSKSRSLAYRGSELKKHNLKPETRPYIWAFTTYFAEGLPYTLIRTVSSFFFRAQGVSLEAVGLTSLFGLPWIIKFLWAPFLDSYGTKRKWLLLTQGGITVSLILIALLTPFSWSISLIAFLFFLTSFIAATHDTAIDGYYMEALDNQDQAKFIGYRVMAYRIAMMFGSGVVITVGTSYSWLSAFALSAVTLGLLFLFHLFNLPKCETETRHIRYLIKDIFSARFLVLAPLALGTLLLLVFLYQQNTLLSSIPLSGTIGLFLVLSLLVLISIRKKILSYLENRAESNYAQAFLTFVNHERIGVIIAFIIFVRAGEFMLAAMVGPFFIDTGFKVHYGWVTGAIGLPCSIIGAMVGGWCISRFSLKKVIWPFILAQNITNLFYMSLALYLGKTNMYEPISVHLLSISAVTAFDHLAGGLGTAVLMTFLMGLCSGKFKAAHYAIGTGLMSVSAVYAGSFSGFLVAWAGYPIFFAVSFLISIPGMVLIFFLPGKQSLNVS